MESTLTTQLHWLVRTVREAGLADADQLTIPATTPIAGAWELACRVCGVGPDGLAAAVAARFGLPVADLRGVEPHVIKLLPEKVARRHGLMPLREDDHRFVVATSNPTDFAAEQDVEFATGRVPSLEIAPPEAILDAITDSYTDGDGMVSIRLQDDLASAVEVLEEVGPEAVDASEVESAPVIKLTNYILRDAVKDRASDIHLEPGRAEGAVRIRVDGVMRTLLRMPMPAMNRVVTRVKIMGKLDIADRLRPQDGRARIQVDHKPYELRISTVPTRDSEKCVIRILDHATTHMLPDLGLPPTELQRIQQLLAFRSGIVIVTGPTGSGKTTTLYAAIRELATGEVNIMTVEDPVEYELAGITQIQVETKRKVTFASALRAILRQDPDVILIGEIRDLETAEVALQASMTGHLVLATLHTNDAASAIERLLDIGADRAGIATALRGVIAQRLVRRVCDACGQDVAGDATPEEQRLAQLFGTPPVRRGVGCTACGGTGYRGRAPVIEVLSMNKTLSGMVTHGSSTAELSRVAVEGGMRRMLETGLVRVAQGETTLEEVERVLGGDREGDAPASLWSPDKVVDVDAKPPAILVVDDDQVQRALARRLLEKAGYRVEEAASGDLALEKLAADPACALVVLDFTMPGLDGLEVLTRLRTDAKTQSLPVIVATAQEDEGLEVRLMEGGADDYIRKPIDPQRFVARVKAALRRAAA